MKLSIDGIKDKTAWEEAGIKLPAYDVRKVAENTKASPVWVHFGIGNIFRIFIGGIAAYTFVWDLGDVGIGLMTIFNTGILYLLGGQAVKVLRDFEDGKNIK